jgi:hypothetical protein
MLRRGSEIICNRDFSYRGTSVSALMILDFFITSVLATSGIPYSHPGHPRGSSGRGGTIFIRMNLRGRTVEFGESVAPSTLLHNHRDINDMTGTLILHLKSTILLERSEEFGSDVLHRKVRCEAPNPKAQPKASQTQVGGQPRRSCSSNGRAPPKVSEACYAVTTTGIPPISLYFSLH